MGRVRPTTFACALALGCTAVVMLLLPISAGAATQFRVLGRGWGHGIGLSQYGAQGFAKQGYTAQQIVQYYYDGVSLGATPADAATFDVLLVDGRSAVSLQIDKAGSRVQVGGAGWDLAAGDQLIARVESGKLNVYRRAPGASETLVAGAATSPVTVSGPAGALQTLFRATNGHYGRHYRGSMQIHKVGSSISVVNQVPLEQYLYGVVPAEMPSSWHPEALKAQAIVARSYAVATRKPSGLFDAYADTRSQMYSGIEAEQASTNAAVDATAGAVAVHGGAPIPTFFYSTSGGRTAAIEDVWGSAPRPYLKSKPDPYEASPYSSWKMEYTQKELARKLGSSASGTLRRIDLETNASQRVRRVSVVGSRGTTTLSGTSLQYKLGLRSSWYRVEKLSVDSRSRRVSRGARVVLHGEAPRRGATFLAVKSGDTWVQLQRLKVRKNGGWVKRVRARTTTRYGLMRSGAVGPQVLIRVT